MILKVIFIMMPNMLWIQSKVPDHANSSKNSIQQITKNIMPSEVIFPFNTSVSHTSMKTSRKKFTFPNSSARQFIQKTNKIPGKNAEGSTFKEIWYLLNKWLTKIYDLSDSSYKLQMDKLTTKFSNNFPRTVKLTKPLQLQHDHITFFQLWKEILRDQYDTNFTLNKPSIGYNSSNRNYNGSYDRFNKYMSKTKEIIVEDARYTSLIEKWITNRHARNGDFSTPQKHNVSTSMNLTIMSNESQSSCDACLTPSGNVSISLHKKQCSENYTLFNGSKLETHCNASNENDTAIDKSNNNPEARVYDPLMPYPEEYPEEYQTIQNGPALIISRTTYTRIPNVTYTTITMVTLPTYRLVEKAEDGFAATLFDERSSKRNLPSARCNEEYSFAILQQKRHQ